MHNFKESFKSFEYANRKFKGETNLSFDVLRTDLNQLFRIKFIKIEGSEMGNNWNVCHIQNLETDESFNVEIESIDADKLKLFDYTTVVNSNFKDCVIKKMQEIPLSLFEVI
jgi:hypothetical protein